MHRSRLRRQGSTSPAIPWAILCRRRQGPRHEEPPCRGCRILGAGNQGRTRMLHRWHLHPFHQDRQIPAFRVQGGWTNPSMVGRNWTIMQARSSIGPTIPPALRFPLAIREEAPLHPSHALLLSPDWQHLHLAQRVAKLAGTTAGAPHLAHDSYPVCSAVRPFQSEDRRRACMILVGSPLSASNQSLRL